jgi:hydrogenase-4 membrane subunit HyfE
MSPGLAIFLCLFLLPLFVSSWRLILGSLAAQGFLLAWIAYRANPHWEGIEAWLSLIDHLLLRGIALPFALYATLRARKPDSRMGILPPNILAWSLALASVPLAFKFASLLAHGSGIDRAPIAVAAAGILLGFAVLSTPTGMFGQMVGLVCIENAIALFGQTEGAHGQPVGIQIGLLAATAVTIALYRWFLAMPMGTKPDPAAGWTEGPTI